MGLPLSAKRDLEKIIDSEGLNRADFEWIKRKGWVNVISQKGGSTFQFFRKKSVELREGQWVNSLILKTSFDGEKQERTSWSEVLSDFRSWIQKLPEN